MVDVAELSWTVTGEASGERTAVVLNQMTQAAAGAEAGLDRVGATSKRTATDLAGITSSATSAGGAARQTATEMAGLSGASTNATSSLRDMAQAVMAVDAAESAAAQGARELTSATAGISPTMDRSAASARSAAVSYGDFYDAANRDFATQWVTQGNRAIATGDKLARSNTAVTRATLNMTRQFSDVGVSIASGMPIWMVAIQQGSQIQDGFAQAKSEGVGFAQVLRSFGPLFAVLAPIAVAVGGIALAFNVAAGEIEADNRGLINTLGLTEDQLEKVKNKSVTMGDVMQGVWRTAAQMLTAEFGPQIAAVAGFFDSLWAGIVRGATNTFSHWLGVAGAAYRAIEAIWRNFPAVIGDAAVGAVNIAITAMNRLMAEAAAKLNALRPLVNTYLTITNSPFRLPEITAPQIALMKNQHAGAMANVGAAARAGYAEGVGVIGQIVQNTLAAATDRWRNEAGDIKAGHDKAAKAARDQADELEKLRKELENLAEEVQAIEGRLGGPAAQAMRRYQEETETLRKALMAGLLPYEKWVSLTDALGAELHIATVGVKELETNVSGLRGPMEGVKFETEDWGKKAEEAMERFDDLSYSIGGVLSSFRDGDWAGAMSGLMGAINGITEAWKRSKTEAALALAAGVGQMIGGRAGGAISGAASGAMMGMQLGSIVPVVGNVAGAVIGGALGLLGGLFGGGGEKKRQREEEARRKAEEEARKAAQIAAEARAFEIRLIELTQGEVAALAERRKDELAATDASNRAALEHIWALEDEKVAAAKAAEEAEKLAQAAAELAERLAEARDFAADIAQDLLTRIDPFQGALAGLARSQAARQAEVDALRNVLPVDEFATLTDQVARLNALELDEIMAKFTVDLIAGSKALQEGLGAFLPGGGITTADEIAADRQRRLDAERAAAADSATAAEEAAAAWAETVKAVEDGRRGLVLAGNVAGALAAEWSITKLDPGTFTRRDGSINIGALNFEVAKAQAENAKRLANLASANALQVQDVGRVLTQLRGYVGDNLDNPLGGGVNQGMLARIAGIVGAGYSEAIRDAVQGLTGVLANEQVRQRYQAGGPGLAGVRFAQENLAFAREARDVVAYRDAIGQLQGQLREGVITFGDYTRAVEAVDQLMGSAIAYLDPVMAAIREAGAIAGYQQAGLDSIAYYFGEIASATAALNAAAAEAEEPISLVAAAVGRLTSIAQVFNESVAAATYMGANADSADVATAQLIAEAAAVAARVITTADAARIAAEIANDPAFAGMSPTALRDTSLLLDGLQAFDPVAFENTFLRLNNALVTEAITREQYAVLFNRSLDIFGGMDEAAKAIDDMRRAAGSFADAFLLSSGTTLMGRAQFAEAYRQYQGLLARVRGGDVGAFGDLTDAATTLRDRGNSTFSTFLEAQNLQDQIVDAFRDIEANGIATSHEERLELGVNRMADTAERMEDLLERGNALLASIDGNQAEARKTVERSLAQP